MSEVLGDVKELHENRIPFSAVITTTGSTSAGHVLLSDATGFRHLLAARASVQVVSQGLVCQVVGPASASKAVSCHVAVVPGTLRNWPTTPEAVMTIGGSAFVQHSLYVTPASAPLSFAPETAHSIKPVPVYGGAPTIVYHCTITGGSATDSAHIRVSGMVEVDGIGFAQSW